MNRKLFTGLFAVLAYGVASELIIYTGVNAFLATAIVTSACAVGLIIVEWSRV